MWKKLDRDLTEADVGKKVRLRSGDEEVITDFKYTDNTDEIPVRIEGCGWYGVSGMFYARNSNYDIVEIFEEVEKSDTSQEISSLKWVEYVPQVRNIVINLEEGTEVIKGRFQDSKGDTYYVTIERTN